MAETIADTNSGADTTSAHGDAAQVRRARPLSPHLTVYRFIPTMVMSILHRITGVGLYFGTVLLIWWLTAAASGAETFETAQWFFGSPLGLLILFGYTWVLLHHMLGGIKHLVWDTGAVGDRETNRLVAIAQPIASAVLTLLVWIVAFVVR